MTDVNGIDIQSASSPSHDDEDDNKYTNNSYLLNQSSVPMDVDMDDEVVTGSTAKANGYSSRDPIENGTIDEQEKKEVVRLGNPVLNKSFDVLPQVKDDQLPSIDPTVDNTIENSNTLDTTVELPTNELDEKISPSNITQFMSDETEPIGNAQELLSNQFSLEYPYVIPQPQENLPSSSPPPPPAVAPPNSLESVAELTKNMKLNMTKIFEGQEPSTPTFNPEKTFDTNTFVLKKKERRKATTPGTDTSFNAVMEDTTPDLCNKQSPFNTPTASLDAAIASRAPTANSTSSQQPTMDPTRIIISSTTTSSILDEEQLRPKDINTTSLNDFLHAEKSIFQPPSTTATAEADMIKSLIMSHENVMEKSTLFRSLIEHTEPTVNAQQLTEHFSLPEQQQKLARSNQIDEHLLRPFSECVEQYYRILYRVCECTEELKHELRQVKNERDQMSEDLINAENAYADVKKRNEKLKLIINEHKMNTETLKRFSEESVRYTEEQKQKYAVLKQHAQEKLNEANSEIERLRRTQASEMEGVQTQLRYAQLRVQSLEQEMKSVKQELEQKKKENIELTNICDELLATNKR
ncbi:unnamed protein product [Adineta ricciae]|uniref:Transforming acidic coiled-coil-containing protein C-terminal domain-containing protein n=1 Tax=Adineta ricciae TaxID=249248 RepID=A0A815V744_ADIRI|nr:unnamed protein product [Adineta ricciae]